MACFRCGETDHMKADCPMEEPPMVCRTCAGEGHKASDCSIDRMVLYMREHNIKLIMVDEAWHMVVRADKEKDVHDFKIGLLTYRMAFPELTAPAFETSLRDNNMNFHIIAMKQEISDTHTIINLQGEKDQEYALSFQLSDKPRRAINVDRWPATPEENLERLEKAGFVVDGFVTKCHNCGGEQARSLPT